MNRDDASIEISKDITELDAPFVMVFGPEMTDTRLSPAARLFRIWLRFRCYGDSENNFVSLNTLAQDMDVDVSTIKRWVGELKSIGAIVCKSRGPGLSTYKSLIKTSSVYGLELLIDYRKLLKDRTQDSLDIIHIKSCVPSADGSLVPSSKMTQLKNEPTPHGVPSSKMSLPPGGTQLKNEPLYTSTLSIDKYPTADKESSAAQSDLGSDQIVNIDQEGGFIPLVTEEENLSRDDDRASLARLAMAPLSTPAEYAANLRKKAKARTESSEWAMDAAEKRKLKAEAKAERAKNKPTTSNEIERLWLDRHRSAYSNIPFEKWTLREKKWAADMIDAYGVDLTKMAVDHVFSRWDRIREDNAWRKLGPVPLLSYLYSERKTIMPNLAIKESPGTSSGASSTLRGKKYF